MRQIPNNKILASFVATIALLGLSCTPSPRFTHTLSASAQVNKPIEEDSFSGALPEIENTQSQSTQDQKPIATPVQQQQTTEASPQKREVAVDSIPSTFKSCTTTGRASYYANKFHGHKTASGERYNKHELTAAHRTLPFGTRVKVTNTKNNASIIVRINDRGPFSKNLIIDVSYVAAQELNMITAGVIPVTVETLP